MFHDTTTSSIRRLRNEFWKLLPSFCLLIVIIAPPFAGTISLYRAAMFILIGHTLVSCILKCPTLSRPLWIILLWGGGFTFWSLLSAIHGIDPRYSLSRWESEHLYGYLFFCAIVLNPCGYSVPLILWGGILSIGCIALGMEIDWSALDQPSREFLKNLKLDEVMYRKLYKAAHVGGFSTDITWLTGHLIFLQWLGLAAVWTSHWRSARFWGGITAGAAGIWVVMQTFQVAAFLVVYVTSFVFLCLWLLKNFGKRGVWLTVGMIAIMASGVAYRDFVLHPEKQAFEGISEFVKSGKTENLHLQSRLNGIRWAVNKCKERPWLGWGPGREILRKVEPQTFDINEAQVKDPSRHPPLGHLHNQFADLLIRTGIPGLSLYVGFLLAIVVGGIRSSLWKADWLKRPGAPIQLAALLCVVFATFRLLAETYPASSIGAQYWMVLGFAALSADAWDGSTLRSFLQSGNAWKLSQNDHQKHSLTASITR